MSGSVPSLHAHHQSVAAIQLSSAVPEQVAIQFETARNLYLYAWHVYRFYMVAETQTLASLEFGLRERLPERLPPSYQSQSAKSPMLKGMLRYAVDQGLLQNDGFRRWHDAALAQARNRRSMDALQMMVDQDIDCLELDEDEPPVVMPQDQAWDFVQVLCESLPQIRNRLAHGSSMLTSRTLGTIELVAEILNQLYPQKKLEERIWGDDAT